MSTARIAAQPRDRRALVDYLAFSLLFASVSVAVAVALGGIVLLLAPSGEQGAGSDGAAATSAQFGTGETARQAGAK